MTRWRAMRLLLASLLMLVWGTTAAYASEDGESEDRACYEVVNVYSYEIVCEYTGSSLQAARVSEPQAKWVVYQLCKDGTSGEPEACANPRVCTVGGVTGTLYAVFKDGIRMGQACLTAGEAGEVGNPPIRTLVVRAFARLDWPASELVVQPPNGKTLVNLKTNFYTTNAHPSDISVRLIGRDVVVTASPITYRWHFGDGTTVTTESPGAPYPDLDVAHVYRRTDEVLVSVDTQYGDASFTVDGGPSEDIPSTIWVTGASQDLEIVEALPQLVLQ